MINGIQFPRVGRTGSPARKPIDVLSGSLVSRPPIPTTSSPAGISVLGSFKKGGEVPKTGVYQLEKGEKVTPVMETGKRDSEYRRVFLSRKKKAGGSKDR